MEHARFSILSAASVLALAASLAMPNAALAQASGVSDPGLRSGTPALLPLAGLNAQSKSDLTSAEASALSANPNLFSINANGPAEIEAFNGAAFVFTETVSVLPPGVSGHIVDSPAGSKDGGGLGPGFNMNSCIGCHGFPIEGGASGKVNPQVTVATLDGAKNTVPPFISANGPVREARLIKNGGVTEGGVHDIYVVSGRTDAAGCTAAQINWPQQVAANNVVFRIPINTFGDGLVEAVSDQTFVNDAANVTAEAGANGITMGVFNKSGNTLNITRFGWKAQNPSLLVFAGEAYNVEEGVTNDAFPDERRQEANCQFNALPEDTEDLSSASGPGTSDITSFALFSRLLAPPAPAAATSTTTTGKNEFVSIGCAECHIPTHVTGASAFTGQSGVTFSPFSDFALHDMGTGLADQVSQGGANGLQFRTAPLWGTGQKTFFLHDGRTSNLVTAIEAHRSSGSEANGVISNFNGLSAANQQAIITFLRSL